MFAFAKKLDSLRYRVIAWVLIAVIPVFVITMIWIYLFLNYFYHHYALMPLADDSAPQLLLSIQSPLVQETLIACGILFGIICIYVIVISMIANKRMHKLFNRLIKRQRRMVLK